MGLVISHEQYNTSTLTHNMLFVLLLGLFAVSMIIVPTAHAQRAELCFEDVNDMCGLISDDPADIFGAILVPLESQVPGFALVILWGGILGIIWFKTENIMLLGIVGLVVSVTITGLSDEAQGIGMLLLGVSIGILSFQLIRQRVSVFS